MKAKCTIAHHPDMQQHLTGEGHPEAPARYGAIIEELIAQKLLSGENTLTPSLAALEVISLCHTPAYIELVEKECAQAQRRQQLRGEVCLSTGDVCICPRSFESARLATGAAVAAVDTLMKGEAESLFCCVRPPGHHATSDAGMGFCIFNNVAIAARYAQKEYGVGRVAIIDWDVHHGNGTQEIFQSDPSVFYFSTHQEHLYPGTGLKAEKGVGNILNCPIKGGKGARKHVLDAFTQPLADALADFKPQLIFISAGFDAHREDPLGGFDLSEDDFATLTSKVKELAYRHCAGKLISVLEGGYHLKALAKSVAAHVKVLSTC